MKLLKKILLGLAGLVVLLLIVAVFVPKDYTVERSVTINRPKQAVYDYVKVLRNQPNWSTWAMMDPNIRITYRGEDGQPGSVYAWESAKMGKGEQEIKSLTEGERIDIEMRFLEPFASVAPVYFTTESLSENQTRLLWSMTGHMAYPTNLMRLVMSMDKMLGSEFEKSLANLKGRLENQSAEAATN